MQQWSNKTSKHKLVEYKSNIPAHNLTNPDFNLISKVINLVTFTNFFEGKNYLLLPNYGPKFYQKCEQLNFNVPCIILQRNKIYLLIYNKTISLRCYVVMYPSVQMPNYQVQIQFFNFFFINSKKQISKKFENKFSKTKLVSSSLRTAVVKLVYSATRFV